MKFTDADIEAIRERTSIVELARRYTELEQPEGHRNHRGRCPVCQHATGFRANDQIGFFYCFSCRAQGDVFSLVIRVEGIPFLKAVAKVSEANRR